MTLPAVLGLGLILLGSPSISADSPASSAKPIGAGRIASELSTIVKSNTESDPASSRLFQLLSTQGEPSVVIEKVGDCSNQIAGVLTNVGSKRDWSNQIATFNLTVKSKISCKGNCCAYLPDAPPFGDTEYRLTRVCLSAEGRIRSIRFKCQLQ